MRAVILVGGFGTRLRPLTSAIPKQMLPVVQIPMIERVVAGLARYGVTEAILALGYRPDQFVAAYPDGTCAGVALHYAVEPEPLDTAGAIRFAALDAGIDETFLVVNGDVLNDFDFRPMLELHRRVGAEGTLHLTPVDDPSRYGVVPTDADGRVLGFIEKPPVGEAPTRWINAGTYVLEPSILDRIAGDRKVSVEREIFPAIAADGRLFAWQDDCYWVDAGTASTYLQVQLDLIDGLRGDTLDGIDPTARIAADAVVEHSVVGPGVVIESGAEVLGSVLLAGVVVEAGASVHDSIVANGSVIEKGAALRELSVIGADQRVEAGSRLVGISLPA
jgi:mannose-1-phosphate guanylyltransferase